MLLELFSKTFKKCINCNSCKFVNCNENVIANKNYIADIFQDFGSSLAYKIKSCNTYLRENVVDLFFINPVQARI